MPIYNSHILETIERQEYKNSRKWRLGYLWGDCVENITKSDMQC